MIFKHLIFPLVSIICFVSCENNPKKKIVQKNKTATPNIIYILADDLGYGDLSCYGQQKFETPNIDRLASQGMLFTQHYSGNTVCAPSRSALLTGMHTGHTFIRGNKEVRPEGQYPIPDSTYTLAEALKKANYVTGAFGKWGLGYPGSEGDPTLQGFDTFYGYNCQRYGHNYYPKHLWSNRDSIVLKENLGQNEGIYVPELIHRKTLNFIEKNKDTTFFLYVASIIPHAELAAPQAAIDSLKGKYLPDNPYKGVDQGEGYKSGAYGSQETPHAAFVAMVKILDAQVGEIMDKVDELGLTDNTIIVFTSDNGPHKEGGADPDYFDSNGPLKGYKRDLYEGGIRVPMIVKWPEKIEAGSKTDHISAFWDVFPTFGEIAALPLPKKIDGISFLPTLLRNNVNQKEHEYLYWEFHELGGRQAVRMGKWKGVKYNVLENPKASVELYDLKNDIGETVNVASENPEIVNQIEQLLKEARTPSDIFSFGQK